MTLLKKKSKDANVVLIFDIGSGSVGGALAVVSKKGTAQIVYHARQELVLQEELDFERFVGSMLEALESVSDDISRNGMSHLTFTRSGDRNIEAAFVVYASPWYLSQTKVLRVRRQRPFTVSKSTIDKLVADEEKLFSKSQKSSVSGKVPGGAVTIERKVTDIKLEGYHISRPFGKKTTEASFTVSMAMIATGIKSKVEEIIGDVFHSGDIIHHSFPLVATSSIRDVFSDVANFLLVDVSGEVTDISVVRDHALAETTTFPHGKHEFLRGLALALRTTIPNAYSQVKIYLDGGMSQDGSRILESAMTQTSQDWLDSFKKAIDSLETGGAVPNKLFLVADTSVQKLFSNLLASDAVAITSGSKRTFDIAPLVGSDLAKHIRFRKGPVEDVFLGVEAYFVNKTLNVL